MNLKGVNDIRLEKWYEIYINQENFRSKNRRDLPPFVFCFFFFTNIGAVGNLLMIICKDVETGRNWEGGGRGWRRGGGS